MPFFACQVLTFSVFCGIIAFVHSDDSFRIGVWLLNSTTESSLWILFFTIAASFYIPRLIIDFAGGEFQLREAHLRENSELLAEIAERKNSPKITDTCFTYKR